ncbi:hypothetical protein DXG01_000465 [Tephrocybe rancida]|nr:hypothetical protein DXG01_000465 [Tephrocybe rancida]
MIPPVFAIQRRDAPDSLADAFRHASWIWTLEADSPYAPAGDRVFRRTYTPPGTLTSVFADIIMTVDDEFSLYVNGIYIGGTQTEGSWTAAQRFNVSLQPGATVFAVRGKNVLNGATGEDTTAGVLAAIEITHSDGSTSTLISNNNWLASKVIPTNFEQPHTDDSAWPEAHLISQYGAPPWLNGIAVPAPFIAANLPSSTFTAANLSSSTSIAASLSSSTSTAANLPSSTSTAPSFTPLPLSSKNLIGPIVGGVLGGVVILSLLITLLWFRKRGFKLKLSSSIFLLIWFRC